MFVFKKVYYVGVRISPKKSGVTGLTSEILPSKVTTPPPKRPKTLCLGKPQIIFQNKTSELFYCSVHMQESISYMADIQNFA